MREVCAGPARNRVTSLRAASPAVVRCSLLLTLGTPSPQQLTARLRDARHLEQLVEQHAEHGAGFNGFHLGAFWGSVKRLAPKQRHWLNTQGRAAFTPACEQTTQMLPTLEPRSLAMVAHALARARLRRGEPWETIWRPLPEAIRPTLERMNAQELANSAWAFAAAGRNVSTLFEAIAKESLSRRLEDFSPQGLSNTAWAFTTAECASEVLDAPALFEAIADSAATRISAFNAQELSNIAWAFAAAGHRSPALFDAIAAEAEERREQFKPQELSITLWAFARAEHPAPALFEALSKDAEGRVGDFNAQDISNIAWACATAEQAAPALFEALAAEASKRRLR